MNEHLIQPSRKRDLMAAARRAALLEAGLEEFLAKGFADARIEEIARRADVAKGTVYVHFKDKEDLFVESIRAEMAPVAAAMATRVRTPGATPREALESIFFWLLEDVMRQRPGEVIRLMYSERVRFPVLTAFYDSEIIQPMIDAIGLLLGRARASGCLRVDEIADYPQLAMAPLVLLTFTMSTPGAQSPDRAEAMLKAHLANIFA